MDAFENYFGYNKLGKNIYLDWSHLPFMQVFEKQKSEIEQIKINSLTSLLSLGVELNEANEYLDTNFNIKEVEEGENADTVKAQANLRGSVGGVTGLISLLTSVAEGLMTRESAIGIMTVVYGFTSEEAQNILGPKIEVNEQENRPEETQEEPAGQEENIEE